MNLEQRNKVLSLLSEARKSVKAVTSSRDYPTLKENILRLEFEHGLKALEHLSLSDAFAEDFKALCASRESDKENSIPFIEAPNSPINKLYWDIASLVFEPKTMGEMLHIIAPSVQQHAHLTYPDILPRPMNSRELREYKNNLVPTISINKNLNELEEAPSLKNLGDLVFSDKMVFKISDMSHLPLRMHMGLLDVLQEKYPEFSKNIYTHNADFEKLMFDIKAIKNNGITPYEAISQLYATYALGGSEVTGHQYASEAAIEATKKFLAYFYRLPQSLQNDIQAVDGGTFGSILANQILKGTCVHGSTTNLHNFLLRNKNHALLTSPPNMTQAECDKQYAHYNKIYLNTERSFTRVVSLPSQLTFQAMGSLHLTDESRISLLTDFPYESYDLLFDSLLRLTNSNPYFHKSQILADIQKMMQHGVFGQERFTALVKSLSKYFRMLNNDPEISFLGWCLTNPTRLSVVELLKEIDIDRRFAEFLSLQNSQLQNLQKFITSNPDKLSALLQLFPERQRLDVVRTFYWSGFNLAFDVVNNTESLKALLSVYPADEVMSIVLAQNISGEGLLHIAAKNPEALKILLSFLPPDQRLAAVKEVNSAGNSVLHMAVGNIETLKMVLSLLPETEKLNTIQSFNINGTSLLHAAARNSNPEGLKILLLLWLEEQRLDLVKTVDYYGDSLISLAADNFEKLKALLLLLPENQRFEAVKSYTKNGGTLLHTFAKNNNIQALKMLLTLWPEESRFEAVKSANNDGDDVIHLISYDFETLRVVLSLLPEGQRFEAVKKFTRSGTSLLHRAAREGNSKGLLMLLSLWPAVQRLNAVKIFDSAGESVLDLATSDCELLRVVLSQLPENQRMDIVTSYRKNGSSLLHLAASNLNSDVIRMLLGYWPEDQRIEAVTTNYAQGENVLFLAVNDSEVLKTVLSLLPQDKVFETVKNARNNGSSLLHAAARVSHSSLHYLLSLWPEDQRLEAIGVIDSTGANVLDLALTNSPEMLHTLLLLLPESQRFKLVSAINPLDGNSILHRVAAMDRADYLSTVLSFWPADQRLAALKRVNVFGTSALDIVFATEANLLAVISLLPESQRFELIVAENESGESILSNSINHRFNPVQVLQLLPENQRWSALKHQNSRDDKLFYQHLASSYTIRLSNIERCLPMEQQNWLHQLELVRNSHKLFSGIRAMREHAQYLRYEMSPEDCAAIAKLADELETKAIKFFMQSLEKRSTPDEVNDFQDGFIELLHSKDDLMQVHRISWVPILNNILIGLITGGIGFIAIAIKASINAVKLHGTGKKLMLSDVLFFAQTQREKNVGTIDECVDHLDKPDDEAFSILVSA